MFPIPGTHFTSDMRFPSWKTHITSEMCSLTTRIKAICVSQVGEHISLGIFVSWEGKEIPLVMSVPLLGKHKSLVKCVPLPGKHDMCFPGRRTHITVSFVGEIHFTKDGGTHITDITVISLVICVPLPGNRDDYLWNTYPYWYVFPYHTTHITSYMCSLFRETHIANNMRSPTQGTHISGDMLSRNAMCSPFPLPGKHISLVIQCIVPW